MLFCWWDKNETRSDHAYTMLERWVLQIENHLAELNLNQALKRSESFKNIEKHSREWSLQEVLMIPTLSSPNYTS